MSTSERLKAIQRRLDLTPDGVFGPATLTALEALLDDAGVGGTAPTTSLIVSKLGLRKLVEFEITSEATWPDGTPRTAAACP